VSTPPAPHAPTRRRRWLLGAVGLLAIAGAVAVYLGPVIRGKESGKPGRKPAAAPQVVVATVAMRSLPVVLAAIGNVEPYTSVAIKSRVDGQVVEVNFKEGQQVHKREVLFRLDARPFEAALRQAEANLARDLASRERARSQERRYKDLLDKNFVSQDGYAQFRTNAETAEAVLKASQAAVETARLNLDYCTIRSPIDGYVGKVLLQAGNLVKANDTLSLVVINQVKPIYASFAVPEQQLGEIRRRMADGPLAVTVVEPETQKPLATGQLAYIDNAVDASTGTIKLRAVFDNADLALWPGQFVNVRLKLYEQKNAIVVPSAAVQTGPQGEYVFVIGPDATAQVRKVAVTRTEGDLSVIASGLAQGDRVVTRGQLRLSPGVKVVVSKKAAS
jgi:multidrug efflux system membrane fusion protein